jgi:signal transduction histidine kinase
MGQEHRTDAQPARDRDLQARYEALQRAYHRLQETQRLRRDQEDMILHDLRTPLSVILASLEQLRDEPDPASSVAESAILDIAYRAGEEMLQLLTDLLEVQRLETDQMPIHLQPVDVAHIVRTTVDQVRCLAEQEGVALCLCLPEPPPWAWADGHLTSRVVMNLVDNAIQHTPDEGEVRVAVRASAREIIVSVADSGPGIPTGHQDHLFEKFPQVERGARSGRRGLGLGLAFCRMAVEAQRGWIEVESEPETGALFRFGLPLWPGAEL